jgi:signal peptidase II
LTPQLIRDRGTSRKGRDLSFWVGVFLGVVFLDQAAKYLASRLLTPRASVEVVEPIFRLTLVRNPGGIFGIVWGGTLFYLFLSFLAIGLVAFYLVKARLFIYRCSFALILGGALGNLADRLRWGEVVDFLDFGLGRYRWPTFNLADSAITIGILLLLFASFRREKGEEKNP